MTVVALNLFNDLVREHEERRRHSEAKSVCGRAAHYQPNPGDLLHREICGMFAFQDPVDVLRCRPAYLGMVGRVGEQRACLHKVFPMGGYRQPFSRSELYDQTREFLHQAGRDDQHRAYFTRVQSSEELLGLSFGRNRPLHPFNVQRAAGLAHPSGRPQVVVTEAAPQPIPV